MTISAPLASAREKTTFCWLPPESCTSASFGPLVLMRSLSIQVSACSRTALAETKGPLAILWALERTMLSSTESVETMPS